MRTLITHAQTSSLLLLCVLASTLIFTGCKKAPKEVEITHQRELCKFDENEMLRFVITPLKAKQPLHWRRVPSTKHRILNYRAGEKTEIAITTINGSIKANIDRWYKQFKQTPPIEIDSLKSGTMLAGRDLYLTDLKGNFQTSMGGSITDLKNWSMLGILCRNANDELISIKMTGPITETSKEKEHLIQFAQSLKILNYEVEQPDQLDPNAQKDESSSY